ncbi:MAG: HEAT repeat domain-containing protein [Proteobacteria bacterium]|nr:HEAT repeat domain-containing protein [Pseudomonadota bacterium]
MRRALIPGVFLLIAALVGILQAVKKPARDPAGVSGGSGGIPRAEAHSFSEFALEYSFSRTVSSQLVIRDGTTPVLELAIEGQVSLVPAIGNGGRKGWSVGFEGRAGNSTVKTRAPVIFEEDTAKATWTLSGALAKNDSERDEHNLLRDWAALYAFHALQDAAGEYEARFLTEGAREIKIKERYAVEGGSKIEITESRHELEKGASGVPEKISGREHTRIPVQDGLVLETSSQYEIRLTRVRPALAASFDFPALIEWKTTLEEKSGGKSPERGRIERRFSEEKLESHSSRIALFHDWVRLLAGEPALIGEFRKLAESVREQEGRFVFAIGVLASVPCSVAQEALVDWYREEEVRPGVRLAILNALAISRVKPEERTISFLEELARRDPAAIPALEAVLSRR